MNTFRSLAHRPFALLWSGQTISRLGDSVYRIALAWWVLEKTGSATAMGTVLVFSSVPMLLFLLVGGVVVDRFPRLRVMLISDLLSGAVVLAVALLAYGNLLEVWHIYIASIVFGLVEAFFYPAYTATVPDITFKELLPSANSLTSLSQAAGSIVGPALGASIIALGGTSLAFGLDGISFLISAVFLWLILRSNPTPHLPPSKGVTKTPGGIGQMLEDLRQGLKAVIASPWLWISISLFGFINITASGPRSVALPFLVSDNLHADVGTLGLFTSVFSVGFVVGALWLGHYTQLRRRGLIAYLATAFGGLTSAVFGLSSSIPILSVAALLTGITIAVISLIWTNTLQELVPPELLGRVSSIDALGSFVLMPIGFGLAGWATDLLGAPQVFLIGGLLTAFLPLLGLAHPAIRNLD
jgi:MFS family permease